MQAGREGGLEASERQPPGGSKHGLEQKGSPNYLKGYPFQKDLYYPLKCPLSLRVAAVKRDVPVLHTGLISCSTGTSIPPKVENRDST
jgi:hypothetical protein